MDQFRSESIDSEAERIAEIRSVRRAAVATASLIIAIVGLAALVTYAQTPGPSGPQPEQWPQSSELPHASNQPTLVVFLHPRCPCSHATLGELEALLNERKSIKAVIVFLRPERCPVNWEQGELWDRATSIRGVEVRVDRDATESRRFGAATSGHVCLYSADGSLQFSGGITAARGHGGKNPGRTSIESFLVLGHPTMTKTAVFGCPLFSNCEMKTSESGIDE